MAEPSFYMGIMSIESDAPPIDISAPRWSRAEFLSILGVTNDALQMRQRRGELPWGMNGLDAVVRYPAKHPAVGWRRYSDLHLLSWRAADALGLSLAMSCAIVEGALPFIMMGSSYRRDQGVARLFADVLSEGGPYEDEPIIVYAVLARLNGDAVERSEGEGGLFLDPVVAARWQALDKLEQWRASMRRTHDAGIYARRVILIDLAGEYRAIKSRIHKLQSEG